MKHMKCPICGSNSVAIRQRAGESFPYCECNRCYTQGPRVTEVSSHGSLEDRCILEWNIWVNAHMKIKQSKIPIIGS